MAGVTADGAATETMVATTVIGQSETRTSGPPEEATGTDLAHTTTTMEAGVAMVDMAAMAAMEAMATEVTVVMAEATATVAGVEAMEATLRTATDTEVTADIHSLMVEIGGEATAVILTITGVVMAMEEGDT